MASKPSPAPGRREEKEEAWERCHLRRTCYGEVGYVLEVLRSVGGAVLLCLYVACKYMYVWV